MLTVSRGPTSKEEGEKKFSLEESLWGGGGGGWGGVGGRKGPWQDGSRENAVGVTLRKGFHTRMVLRGSNLKKDDQSLEPSGLCTDLSIKRKKAW